jgi:CheY-like chemotaxis protein
VIAAGDAPRLAKCVDLSFGGCYLETASPLPEGARVSLCIRMTQGPPLDATGFVRTSHVHFGMGVRFTSVEHPEILAAALKGFVPSERWSEHPSMVATVSDISLPVPDTNRADKTVLVVDDSLTIRNMVAHHLRRSGYSVAMAKDGEEALSIVQSQRPSLILLDMLMPRMSGLAVLRKLKTNSSTRDIPVVVISSLGDNNNARLLAEGACGFMSKAQISPDKMPQIIDRYLRNPGAARVYEAEVS